ncbi:MAG: 50S ribosomal protein L19e [Nanoarchaeota archaeon]
MKLEKKKSLVVRTLGVGKARIVFNTQRLSEIKEAITKQDIKDLHKSGAIIIIEKKGRRKVKKRTSRRRSGSIKHKKSNSKKEYATLTRKLRLYLSALKRNNKISQEEFKKLRKEIKNRNFRSLSHIKETISGAA